MGGELPTSSPADSLHDRALGELRRALRDEPKWTKVHAAEALLALSYRQGVLDIFEQEQIQHGEEPQYRIGVWRILAQAEDNRARRAEYVGKIVGAYWAPSSPDAVHAVESLAKLGYVIPKDDRQRWRDSQARLDPAGLPFLKWLLAISGDVASLRGLGDLLDSADPRVRSRSAYALRRLAESPPEGSGEPWPELTDRLAIASDRERDSRDRVYLVGAAFVAAGKSDTKRATEFGELLRGYLETSDTTQKYEAVSALAVRSDDADAQRVAALMDDQEADLRIAAAHALLRMDRRRAPPFFALDWLVIAVYAAALIGIGVYYQYRARTTDDYLLGGRTMKPWAVGLSFFATLFSTVTYLAFPGEMIQHGPMILCSIVSFPFIFLVTSYGLIPFIMRLRVTSAYEILDARFGLGVRMLGASLFLIMRLVWMAVIIYATARAVLVPLMRLDDSTTPWVCFVLGGITVVYTSLGGLQAVVWTDVVQTFILFLAAVLSIVMISVALGGIDGWWPRSWQSDWDPPAIWSTSARITPLAAALSTFVWYVCTSGSDQMAIQRYLATRDVRAARRMYGISLFCGALVTLLLAALGLALFAYFKANPRMLPDGKTVTTGADGLLPQYVVRGLPAGLSGLVVAGLLSAAMSSLSSGLNSCCSVITVDWVDRFRRVKLQDADHVRLARRISWLVGGAVVLLTYFAGMVPGNLLEVTNKLVNLLTAPLFVLFFMALFVPWATSFGACMGTAASVAVAVGIAYFELLDLGFLWMGPVSLAAGILAGCLASLPRIGPRRPMLARAAELGSAGGTNLTDDDVA